ncbi:MAG: hypothetical protein COC12_07160 [Rhodobacteraceae bacterium]|nr:MAG: hypothetical protein COC12_07160 [Paracoccaceae bacterium]
MIRTVLLLLLCSALAAGIGLRRMAEVSMAQSEARLAAYVLAGGSRADLCRDAGKPDPTALPCNICKLMLAATLPGPVVVAESRTLCPYRTVSGFASDLVVTRSRNAPVPARGPPVT